MTARREPHCPTDHGDQGRRRRPFPCSRSDYPRMPINSRRPAGGANQVGAASRIGLTSLAQHARTICGTSLQSCGISSGTLTFARTNTLILRHQSNNFGSVWPLSTAVRSKLRFVTHSPQGAPGVFVHAPVRSGLPTHRWRLTGRGCSRAGARKAPCPL